jgi:hypothetical protein
VVEKIAFSDVIDRLHPGSRCIVAEILECAFDKRSIAPTRLISEFSTAALKYLDDVPSRRAGDADSPHMT